MRLASFFYLFLLSSSLACSSGSRASEIIVENPSTNVKNHRIKESLASDKALGCIGLKDANNTMVPPDLFMGLKKCINNGEYDNGAELYYLARLFGAFDAKRVADKSAGQGIAVLLMGTFASIEKSKTGKFQKLLADKYGKGSNKLTKLCAGLKSIGHPTYHPQYMILHGMAAFTGLKGNGLKKDFDASSEWERLLSRNCGVKKGPESAWPKILYELYKGTVQYRSRRGERLVEKADPTTFKALSEAFGQDKKHVFFEEKIVTGADPVSFEVIDFYTGRDKTSIYRSTKRCEKCDHKTFRKIDDKRYVDKNAVYSGKGNTLKRLPDVDAETFVSLNSWFSKDKNNVFLRDRIIPGADTASFKLGSCGRCKVCAEDKNRCYRNENAVPCDCKSRSSSGFPKGIADFPATKAALARSHLVKINFTTYKGKGKFVAGYFIGEPGKQTLSVNCRFRKTKDAIPSMINVDLVAGQFYRIASHSDCSSFSIQRPTLVIGKASGVQLFMRNKKGKSVYHRELDPGKHVLTVYCRTVDKKRMTETSTEVTLNMKPGIIYQLRNNPKALANQCDVSASPLPS